MNFNLIINKKTPFLLLIVLFFMSASLGCSFMKMPWQKKTMVTYEAIGETLNTAKPVLMSLCSTGKVNQADCSEIKAAYNAAVKIYKDLGDVAVLAIDTGDSGLYKNKKQELLVWLEVINNFLLTHQ